MTEEENVNVPETVVEEKKDVVSTEDLLAISKAKSRVQTAISQAEKLAAEARIADLEYRNFVQHIFLKYGMKVSDRIDDSTGEISRNNEEESK